jgi:hypothetical protein
VWVEEKRAEGRGGGVSLGEGAEYLRWRDGKGKGKGKGVVATLACCDAQAHTARSCLKSHVSPLSTLPGVGGPIWLGDASRPHTTVLGSVDVAPKQRLRLQSRR